MTPQPEATTVQTTPAQAPLGKRILVGALIVAAAIAVLLGVLTLLP